MNYELTTYVTHSRQVNQTDEQIKSALLATGWSEADVIAALAPLNPLIPPTPPPPPRESMWVGFLYANYANIITTLAFALLTIFNIWINNTFSPATTQTSFTLPISSDNFMVNTAMSAISPMIGSALLTTKKVLLYGSLATIIVFYPLFLLFSAALKKQLKTKPYIRHFRSRKIPLYILLGLAFFAILFHIIVVIVLALTGVVTTTTFGSLFITMLVWGLIMGYLLNEVLEK